MLYIFVWAALYGLTYTASGCIAEGFGKMAPWVTPLAMVLYTCALLAWLFCSGKNRMIRLRAVQIRNPQHWLYPLPLVLLPVYNLIASWGASFHVSTAVLTVCVSIVEELVFRGVLLQLLFRRHAGRSVYVTSALFALFHLGNLLQGSPPDYVSAQVCCAFAAGLCYGAVTLWFGSLLPCIFFHALTNITAISTPKHPAGLWLCIMVYIGYGIWLIHKYERTDKEILL